MRCAAAASASVSRLVRGDSREHSFFSLCQWYNVALDGASSTLGINVGLIGASVSAVSPRGTPHCGVSLCVVATCGLLTLQIHSLDLQNYFSRLCAGAVRSVIVLQGHALSIYMYRLDLPLLSSPKVILAHLYIGIINSVPQFFTSWRTIKESRCYILDGKRIYPGGNRYLLHLCTALILAPKGCAACHAW